MSGREQSGLWRPYHGAVSYATRWVRASIALAIMSVLGWLGGCSDSPPGPCGDCAPPPQGLIVSDAVPAAGLTQVPTVGPALSSGAGDDVAYVSLPPGTVPTGTTASIRRVGDAGSIITALSNGGFDPVAVQAQTSDSIDVIVRDAAGGTVLEARLAVAARRPPIVVRTDPPRKKTDVPLNSAIVVVFSEPVDPATLSSSSVRLVRGTSAVAGTVSLLQGSGTTAAFVPASPLDASTDYQLVVTQAVRDLDGDALEAGVTVEFTTGQSSTGPAASLVLSPDTVVLAPAATYQFTATVRDAAGTMLTDQAIAWSANDPIGLTVSPTGLVTALADGRYWITAVVNGLTQSAGVTIIAGPPASVSVAPTPASVAVGDTITLSATVREADGRVIRGPTVTWTSSDPAAATIAPYIVAGPGFQVFATVTGVSQGSATIAASSGAATGTAAVTVTPPRQIASVSVTPATATLVLQGTVALSATLRDAQGKDIYGRAITWASDNPAAATVDASGLVTGVGVGSALVSATSEGVSDTSAITVTAISFVSLSAGHDFRCGATTTGATYCWGNNDFGQLGDGSTTGSAVPVPVTGGHTFAAVATGGDHTCGLTVGGAALCWGLGPLGDGSTSSSSVPVAVAGGLTFSALSAGFRHSCVLTTSGAAYCWGNNDYGQLGDGSTTGSAVPVAVTGGHTFAALTAGLLYTCGLTTSGTAYCWGDNSGGQLGSGTTIGPETCFFPGGANYACSTIPVLVTGGLIFTELTARTWHTCGLTTGGAAYCWGYNDHGNLGDGSTSWSSVPVAVTGGLTFSALAPGGESVGGGQHTCGVSTSGAAYCWGRNHGGALGNGSTINSAVPVPVSIALSFSALSVGGSHSCGLTTGGVAYCWGWDIGSTVPVKVPGQP